MPEPPDSVPPQVWREMYVEVSAFGSEAVSELFQTLHQKSVGFSAEVLTLRALRAQNADAQMLEVMPRLQAARREASDAFQALQAQIRDELANL